MDSKYTVQKASEILRFLDLRAVKNKIHLNVLSIFNTEYQKPPHYKKQGDLDWFQRLESEKIKGCLEVVVNKYFEKYKSK